jgi:DNA-binding LacI/PurR family transcriptional regulator
VRLDHRAGARLATRHLLDHGHRRVWHVGGPADCLVAREREAGWREALTEAGLEAPPVIRAGWSAAAGHAAGRQAARRPECRAVFAAGDQIALGVLRAMSEAGRTAPADVSVIGFDDLPESAFLSPPLTTIRLDLAAAARTAVGILLGTHAPESTVIDPSLVHRQTVGSASAGRSQSRRREPSAAGR